jgi:hypothetical protein
VSQTSLQANGRMPDGATRYLLELLHFFSAGMSCDYRGVPREAVGNAADDVEEAGAARENADAEIRVLLKAAN